MTPILAALKWWSSWYLVRRAFYMSEKRTFGMRNPCFQYMRQSLCIVNYLENIISPETLPLIFIRLLNEIIIPNGCNKTKFHFFFWSRLFFILKRMMIWWRFNCGGRNDVNNNYVHSRKQLHILNHVRVLTVTNEHWQENEC